MYHGWHHLGPVGERVIEEAVINGVVPCGPFHLELQPTNFCNASCTFCCTAHFRDGEQISWPILQRVIEEESARNLHFVRLIGGGEPLMYKQFGALLATLRSTNVKGFDITSNGILLDRHAESIVSGKCEAVHISLNEPTADLYATTMQNGPASFHRVLAGVRKLVHLRDASTSQLRITLQFMVNSGNWRELERMYGLGVELGCDVIDLRAAFRPTSGAVVNSITGLDALEFGERLVRLVKEDLRLEKPRLNLAIIDNPDLNHQVRTIQDQALPTGDWRVKDFRPAALRNKYCYMPWYSASIAASGRVFSCCWHTEVPGKCLGDVTTGSLQDVWHGDRFQQYRRQMREVMLLRGKMRHSPRCHGCLSARCTEEFGCHITFDLASDDFYDRLAARMESGFPAIDRVAAKSRDSAIRATHTARNLASRFAEAMG